MKKYRLYGELDCSPVSMKSKTLWEVEQEIERLKKLSCCVFWYAIYMRKVDWTETLVKSDIIMKLEG